MSGKLKVRLFDLVQMVSGRVAMREMRCALEGRLPTLQTDADLIAQEISAGVVQLFDRVRFGYAFEIAGQLSAQPSAIPILCPIMNATFRDVTCAEEIVTLIEAQSDIAERLILSFDQTLIMSLRDEERLRIQRLNAAGTRLAMRISTDFAFDPEEITVLGFGFLVASAADLIDDRTEMMQSAIHAADLASYFERYGLMLIANDVDDPAQLIRLKALGIACAGGPVTMRPASTRPTVAARPEERKVTAQAALADKPPASPTSAPLRDRLRRVQA